MRSPRVRETGTDSLARSFFALVALLGFAVACDAGSPGDPTGADSSAVTPNGGGGAVAADQPYVFRPPKTQTELTCDSFAATALYVEGERWEVSSTATLYTDTVYHCTVLGMVMETPTGRVYALGHFGEYQTFEANLRAMVAALEAAGGQRETLETVVGQGGANERLQMPLTLYLADMLDLNVVQVVSNLSENDEDEAASLMEFAFDGLVFHFKRSLACRLDFAS